MHAGYRLPAMFDYTSINTDTIESGIDEAITRAEKILERVVDIETEPNYANVMLPLDEISDVLGQANGNFAFMGYVHSDQEVRNAGTEAQEKLQTLGVEMAFNRDLYRAVTRYAETEEAIGLEGEAARFLEFTLRDLRRAGHELDAESQSALKEKTQRLVELGIKFQQNIDSAEAVLLVDREDLEGLPDAYADSLEPDEETGKLRVTMAYPHVVPFLENATRRDLREKVGFLFNTRALKENRELLEEAIRLRNESAEIFGLSSWAHHVLEERMAKTPERVADFYAELIPSLTAQGKSDIAAMADRLETDTGDYRLRSWDWRYYDTVQRKTEYGIDQYEVAKYLPLDQVLDGMFELCQETFGLTFFQLPDAKAWHADVTLYAIHDAESGELLSHFYLDLFPREGTFGHAAEFSITSSRRLEDGSYQNPVCAMVANFTKPTKDAPSLLQHSELETLFHEFGHVLHQSLGRTELTRFSGTNVERDFVEAPSQIMQHWVWRSDVLKRFARHHETGEPIPDELVDQLVAARRLNTAVTQLRQIQYGVFDAEIHGPGSVKDLDAIVLNASEISLLPFHEGTFFPASFGHLMGGYDASYYGYMWSEVFGDDMFSRFEDEGVTSPDVGMSYRREVLEKGGTLDADELLFNFLGREPDNSAFLSKLGITGTD